MQGSISGKNFEVHNEQNCDHLPDTENRLDLGQFTDCHKAVAHAKNKYAKNAKDIDACFFCCESCHTQ